MGLWWPLVASGGLHSMLMIASDRVRDERRSQSPRGAQALIERNNVAATILLASFALLYVVAGTLPKTSYQTTMDKYVLLNLFIQFVVAFTSWMTTGVFFAIDNATARVVNIVVFALLAAFLIGCSVR